MTRPRLLDLFCGAGGASEGYRRAGFDVVGVDIAPQPRYPFTFVRGDALEYLAAHLGDFDAYHGGPPCQPFCAYRRLGNGVGEGYADLVDATRTAFGELPAGVPWVIENVPGAPLRDPVRLCGSSFGLDVRRHRLFESNFEIPTVPCDHGWQTPRFAQATNRANLRSTVEVGVYRIPLAVQRTAMGIEWMRLRELSESIPPAYTEHVGRAMMRAIAARPELRAA